MKDEKFDELFDEAFERAVSSASPVDPKSRRASWQRVQKHRMQQTSRRRRKRMVRLTGAAAGLILLGSVVFSEPVRTGALDPLYQKLYTWSSGETVVVTGDVGPLETEGALTPPPPEGVEKPVSSTEDNSISDVVTYEYESSTLEEARERLAYPMPEFSQIPSDLRLDEVALSVGSDGSVPTGFMMRYVGGEERDVSIHVDQLPENSNGTRSFGKGKAEEVKLDNGLNGQYIDREYSDIVHTVRGDLEITVSGTLTKDEMLQIAGHIVDGKR